MIVQPSLNINPGGSLVPQPSFSTNNYSLQQTSKNSKNTKKSFSSRFAPSQLSPEFNTSHLPLISVATLNVRGLNIQSKFDSLFQDFLAYNISIIGLQETRLTESNGSFYLKTFNSFHNTSLHAFWSYDSTDSHGGVGILLHPFVLN